MLSELLFAPHLAETDRIRAVRIVFPHQQRNRRSHLNALAIELGREGARVRLNFRGKFSGFILVAVQVIDPDAVEHFQIPLAHRREGEAIEPGVIRNETDHAGTRLLYDAALSHAEEAYIERSEEHTSELQ